MAVIDDIITVARKADVSYDEAAQIIDDVGLQRAKNLTDDAAGTGSDLFSGRGGQALAGTGLVAGGVAAKETNDTLQAREERKQTQEENEMLADILGSDAAEIDKQKAFDLFAQQQGGATPNEDADPGGSVTDKVLDDPVLWVGAFLIVGVVVRTATKETTEGLIGGN